MAQHKKDQIKERIDEAALHVFAKMGYKAAKISAISECAEVSVGNIYRYYNNKHEIFYSVVEGSFIEEFKHIIQSKIGSVKNGMDVNRQALAELTGTFLRFMISNREKIIIVLSGSEGTRYENTRAEFASILLSMVKVLYPQNYTAYISRFNDASILQLIYENLIETYAHILAADCNDEELMRALQQINKYHFSGITSLFDLQEGL